MTIVLGAGLAGLSSSYHLKHDCEIIEKQDHCGGHIYSHKINGFTWDEGPHSSFTKHEYVKNLFNESVNGEFWELAVFPTNYYKGHWIPHPAQSSLYAVPEPIRTACLNSFLDSRQANTGDIKPKNYREWLNLAFGETFTNEFPSAYTLKYWTTPPENLTADWVGERVFYPEIEDVKAGYLKPSEKSRHYITSVRYPKKGGYFSYANLLKKDAKIKLSTEATFIDLKNKVVKLSDGTEKKYTRLINTLPVPEFIKRTDAPAEIQAAAEELSCSQLLCVNVVANHPARTKSHWLYVYDKDKYSTRISFTEMVSPNNAEPGKCGLQVEVYFSKYRKQTEGIGQIVNSVCNELVEMGLVDSLDAIGEINTKRINYANIIFDHKRTNALDKIWKYLEQFGLVREDDDLTAMTNWNDKLNKPVKLGNLIMAGRFGQWKYYWSDDCVMRGLFISKNI